MSTVAQLGGTLNKFFAGTDDKVVQLIKIDFGRLSAFKVVKWERSGSGGSFPHLYATLTGEYVRDWQLVARGEHGWEDALGKLVEQDWLEN